MANTLKFGNGEWATKEGSTLAYNDEGNNYKPLPFTFDRSTSATRVNKEGLIEVVSNNEPRIDFLNDSKGALLLEPTRVNRITNSEQFDGILLNVNVNRNQVISPDGTLNADRLINNNGNGEHFTYRTDFSGSIVNESDYVFSCFFKSDGTGGKGVMRTYVGAFIYAVYDLENGTVSAVNSGGNAKIENYGNGWYRCYLSVTAVSDYPSTFVQIGVGNSQNQYSYQGTSSLGNYFWGVQFEQGSYATSYIPTQGSIGTRVAESCSDAGNEQVFNDSEGVFMFEGSKIEDDGVNTNITISDGTNNNRILISVGFQSKIGVNIIVGNSSQSSYTTASYLVNNFNKIAFSYKLNEFKLFINGINMYTDTSGLVFPYGTLNELNIASGTGLGSFFYGKTKQIQYFDTALSDTELALLTSL